MSVVQSSKFKSVLLGFLVTAFLVIPTPKAQAFTGCPVKALTAAISAFGLAIILDTTYKLLEKYYG